MDSYNVINELVKTENKKLIHGVLFQLLNREPIEEDFKDVLIVEDRFFYKDKMIGFVQIDPGYNPNTFVNTYKITFIPA